MTKRGLTIAQNLSNAAKNSLLTNDQLTLNLLVKDTMKDEDVAYVVVADHDGKVLAPPTSASSAASWSAPPTSSPWARCRWSRPTPSPKAASSTLPCR